MSQSLKCRPLTPAVMTVLVVLIVGCVGPGVDPGTDRASGLSKQRLMLGEGYSLLYEDAGKLDYADLMLYVKAESQAMDDIVTEVGVFGGELKSELEHIARDYPGVRIDLKPLPEMETRKRFAIGKTRALDFAPVIGRSGREYERTVLLGLSNAFNHERHLCKVMAEEEPDAGLKKFLKRTERRYDALYHRTMALLEKDYFKGDDGED